MNYRSRITRAVVLLAIGVALAAHGADFSAWSRRAKIQFIGYNPPGGATTLANFPALVVLGTNINGFSYGDFRSLTYQDLRFTASNGTDELNYEIDKWDTNGNSYVWVQVPALVDTNTCIWAWWSLAGTNAPAYTTNGSTWTNGFRGVWHLAETNGTIERDSSTNLNSGTITGVNLNTNGVVDGGDYFNGAASSACGNSSTLNVGSNSSWEAWIYPTSIADHSSHNVIAKAYQQSWNFGLYGTTARIQLWVANASKVSTGSVTLNQWSHIAATWDGSNIRFFINGVLDSTVAAAGTPVTGNAVTHIGADFSSGTSGALNYWFTGNLDEIRVSGMTRSSNWIWACWSNQTPNSTFVNCGMATNPIVRALNATSIGTNNATLNGRLVDDGGAANTTVAFCWGFTDALMSATSDWPHVEYMGNTWHLGDSLVTNLTGLSSGSTYVYRCYATNTTGAAWSDTQSFTVAYLPVVTNLGPAISNGTVWLRGQITDTGANTPFVWFNYWRVDDVATTTVAIGQQSGAFSTNVIFDPHQTNAYNILASNLAGTVWSSTSSNFVTLACNWKSATTGAWDVASNWAEGVVPTNGDNAYILNSGAQAVLSNSTPNLASLTLSRTLVFFTWNARLTATTVNISSGGVVTLSSAFANGGISNRVYFVCTNFVLATNGLIDASGRGYLGTYRGNGNGPGAGAATPSGAGHGGNGQGTGPGLKYDSPYMPTLPGSGGGSTGSSAATGGSGGGAVFINAVANVRIDGTITADGTSATGGNANDKGSGGSGGSIYIVCSTFAGSTNGLLTARGGGPDPYAGSGGRIAVKYDPLHPKLREIF